MSSSAVDQTERPLSSGSASPPGSCHITSPDIPNQGSLSDKSPNKAFVNGLQSSSGDEEKRVNDPSDVKVHATNTSTELDTNHESSSLGVPAVTEVPGGNKSAIDNSLPDTLPKKASPPPASAELPTEEGDALTPAKSNTPIPSETPLSISTEKELHVSGTASISSPVLKVVEGAQAGATQRRDTNSFDIFDSDDHNTVGDGRCHATDSPNGSIFIGNGLLSPKGCCDSPPPNSYIVTPAPKKVASILTPPPSEEKISAISPSSQEMAPDVYPFEEKTLFTLPHENHNGDVRTLEQDDLPTLPHEGDKGDIRTFKRNDLSTLSHEENHSGGVTPSGENDHFSLPHEESHEDCAHALGRDNLSTPPHENHRGNVSPFRNDHFTSLHSENYYGDVPPFQENGHYTLPHEESHSGDVYILEQNDHSTLPHEENDHYTLPHEESHSGDVYILEQNDHSTLPQEENHSGGVTPFEEKHHLAPPCEESHYGDVAAPNRIPRKSYGAPITTNEKEKTRGRMPRGDYWRPPMTDSRAHSYYRDGYRHREIEDSNHRLSRHHLSDPHHSRHKISRRDRSRSPARNTKRGRFRDRSPFRGRSRSRNGLHDLSGSKVLRQAEDSSGRHHFRTREFNGDRYIPSPKPTQPARRSPAPSPGRELTPPRRTRRNRSPRRRIPPNRSPRRPPPRTLPEHRSGRDLEHAPPIRSSHPLPDQLTAFQNSIRPLNTGHRRVAGSVLKGVHSADMRNPNLVQDSILTSPRRPGKRRRVEDEFPVQHKRSRGYEQSYDENVRDYNAPRSYGSR